MPCGYRAASATDQRLLDWLLDSDPALRWQVERDLAGAPTEMWQATRARVATEGLGAQLLAKQDPDGQWAGGAYFAAGFFGSEEAKAPGQPWNATTWSLKDLREWGVDASVLTDTAERLAANSHWEYNDLPYWGGEIDVCINSCTLATGARLRADVSALNAVRGMFADEQFGSDMSLREARNRSEEYLLSRRLLYRATTGELVAEAVELVRAALDDEVRPRPSPGERGSPSTLQRANRRAG